MIKTFLKFLLCVALYSVVFIAASAVMPYSQGFKELVVSENPFTMLFMLVYNAYVCFSIYFIIRHAHINGKKLFCNVIFVVFFTQSFMAQIETLLFGSVFYPITKLDALLTMLAALSPLIITVPLLIKFFQTKNDLVINNKINVKCIGIKLAIIGIVYLCSFILFGLLVTWLPVEYLTHYGETIANTPDAFLNASIQIFRGILYGVFVIPLIRIIKTKRESIVSICLVYLCQGIQLIIPNELIPEELRIAYFIELTGAMLLFGIVAGNILWRAKMNK
jgi:hypothetical protein